MNLKNKKILVTGADGFIGSHLTEELVRCGYDVRAFVFYNSFNSWGWLDHSEPEIKKNIEKKIGKFLRNFPILIYYLSDIATTPGNSFPSKYSNDAPPPVDMCENLSA